LVTKSYYCLLKIRLIDYKNRSWKIHPIDSLDICYKITLEYIKKGKSFMKKLLVVLTGFAFLMLGACSSPEADEVLEYHNTMVDEINPKLEQIDELYTKIQAVATEQEALDVYENELLPLLTDIKGYYESQTLEHDVAKEYHNLHVELVDAMYAAVAKEKEFVEALLDTEASEEDLLALDAELVELNTIAEEKDKAVTDKWESLKEEYDFIEEEE
jgi:hypothetical protein